LVGSMLVIVVLVDSAAAFVTSTRRDYERVPENVDVPVKEKCYYQITGNNGDHFKLSYGQCMSMNGPDGCCLEGHYKPGLCSNLGHICCVKPDPDCSQMRNNKGMCLQTIHYDGQLIISLLWQQS